MTNERTATGEFSPRLRSRGRIETPICRTCGCSLVRLGISLDAADTHEYEGVQYRFCCGACVGVFTADPERYLEETSDLIVCPTCLAEKPIGRASILNIGGRDLHFCHCPRCAELFQKNPGFYLGRLEGSISNDGVQDHNGCCIRPDRGREQATARNTR